MWQANMHKHISAIITDTWHNTSKPVNITPRIWEALIPTVPLIGKKKKKCTCLCISASAHSLHPHPFQSNPGSQGIIPRRRSKCHRITSTPPLPLSSPHVYSTDIFKKINPSRLNSALLLPTEPSMDHPAVCERVLAPQLAGSFRQAAC